MVNHKSDSGQVILTSAILLAIILVIIALMLNNVIYATNVAYIGFMDGSKYEDLSIRQLTTKEAGLSFEKYPSDKDDSAVSPTTELLARTDYMKTYIESVNLLTNSKGKYVELTDTYYTQSVSTRLLPVTQTRSDLVITNKGSKVKYDVQTGTWDTTTTKYPPSQISKPMVSFLSTTTPPTYSVGEGEAVTLTAQLSNTYDDDVEVQYYTEDIAGSATANVNYVPVLQSPPVTITIPQGQLTQTFTISTINDGVYAPSKAFKVHLVPGTNNNPTIPDPATVNLVEKTEAPGGGQSDHPDIDIALSLDRIKYAGSNSKDYVKITAKVTNTGDTPLSNIELSINKPTDKLPPVSGENPVTITSLGIGAISTYEWVVKTDGPSDKITVRIKGTYYSPTITEYSNEEDK